MSNLEKAPLTDMAVEHALRHLRTYLISNHPNLRGDSRILKVALALALQCHTNDYVYPESQDERGTVDRLAAALRDTLTTGGEPDPLDVACLACYRSLDQFDWAPQASGIAALAPVMLRQVSEPLREAALVESIPSLGRPEDAVSQTVRAQYEESPYPRWIETNICYRPQPATHLAQKLAPNYQALGSANLVQPQILIAGCGTGWQGIWTASQYEGCEVLGFDLSYRSLAFAKRKTEEYGVRNLSFLQGDILDLERLDRQFDIIECTGVLHHMDNPEDGLRALVAKLRPGGLIVLGLYSRSGRRPVKRAREVIEREGIPATEDGIRSVRDGIARSDDPAIRNLATSQDFYTTPTVRDLLFHVQECEFDLLEVDAMLTRVGLRFQDFEGLQSVVMSEFEKQFPHDKNVRDLERWDSIEREMPALFASMYVFWAQRV